MVCDVWIGHNWSLLKMQSFGGMVLVVSMSIYFGTLFLISDVRSLHLNNDNVVKCTDSWKGSISKGTENGIGSIMNSKDNCLMEQNIIYKSFLYGFIPVYYMALAWPLYFNSTSLIIAMYANVGYYGHKSWESWVDCSLILWYLYYSQLFGVS